MDDILGMIQDEQLIAMSWDRQGITKVLNEILQLFQDQQRRITNIESKLVTFCEKQQVEELKERVDSIEEKSNTNDDAIREQIDNVDKEFKKQIDALKEYTDEQNLASISEARRLVTSELATYVPTLSLADPLLSKMDQEIKELAKGGGSGGGGGAGLSTLAESRLGNIENMLMTYPKMQGDLSNLTLQFPVVIRKLERKINDMIPEAGAQKKGSDGSVLDGVTISSAVSTPAGEVDAMTEKEFKKDVAPHARIDDLPPLHAFGHQGKAGEGHQGEKITRVGSQGSVETGDSVVEVHETKTYKTELTPSMRVINELEWAKNVIQQHHEAIKQLQQGIRTQQDNFDAMTDNFMRANATNNSRISQIAQQQLHSQQDADTIRRQIFDQMNSIQQKITSIGSSSAPAEAPVEQNITPQRRGSGIRSTLSNFTGVRGFDKLPMLRSGPPSGARQDMPVFNELEDIPRLSGRRLSEEVPEKAPVVVKKEQAPAQKNFTFVIQQFDATEPIKQTSQGLPSQGSDLQKRKSLEPMKRVPSYGGHHGGGQQKRPQVPKLHPLDRVRREEEEEEEDMSSQQDLTPDKPPPSLQQESLITESFITIGGRIPQRQMRNQAFEMSPEIMEMIEEKVTIIARKVVTILADNAKDDVRAQANEMKKNVDKVVSLVDGKIDREFVERMFNKFRVMLTEMNEKIDNVQCSFLEWVTRDELDLVLQKFMGAIADVKDTAATKTKYTCLLCGQPRSHLAGMLLDGEEPVPERKSLQTAKPRRRNLISRPGNAERQHSALQRPRDIVQFLTMS